jgi:hypothetical protein
MIRHLALAGVASAALCLAVPAQAQEQEGQEGTEATRSTQVLACEEAARLSIDRDRVISQSIEGAQEPDPISGGGAGVVGSAGAFPGELSRFEEDQRRRRLIDDCLARAGLGEEPPPE